MRKFFVSFCYNCKSHFTKIFVSVSDQDHAEKFFFKCPARLTSLSVDGISSLTVISLLRKRPHCLNACISLYHSAPDCVQLRTVKSGHCTLQVSAVTFAFSFLGLCLYSAWRLGQLNASFIDRCVCCTVRLRRT